VRDLTEAAVVTAVIHEHRRPATRPLQGAVPAGRSVLWPQRRCALLPQESEEAWPTPLQGPLRGVGVRSHGSYRPGSTDGRHSRS
jgi:hypothetical protein